MPEDRETGRVPPPRDDEAKDGDIVIVPDEAELPDTISIIDSLGMIAIRDKDLPAGPGGAVVSVMLPFLSPRFAGATLPENSDWALQYYAGLKLGLEDLERRGEQVTVHVFDTEADAGVAQRLVADPDLRQSHAVLGPYLTDVARATATPAQAALLPLVVPYSASTNLAQAYPRLVQLNPTLPTHLDAAAAFLTENYEPEQVVIVGLPNGAQDGAIRYLQRRYREISSDTAASWRVWRLETSDVGLQDLEWEDKFVEDEETIFIFPEYRNAKIVAAFLSQLQIGRGENAATVFGMPQWIEFTTLDPSIMEDIGVLVTSSFHVDEAEPGVADFAEAYIERFGAIPTEAAYLGYDAVRLVVPLANRYGRAWVEHLPPRFAEGLLSDYRLAPVYDPAAAAVDSLTGAELPVAPVRYENRDIDVMVYRGYRWEEFGG